MCGMQDVSVSHILPSWGYFCDCVSNLTCKTELLTSFIKADHPFSRHTRSCFYETCRWQQALAYVINVPGTATSPHTIWQPDINNIQAVIIIVGLQELFHHLRTVLYTCLWTWKCYKWNITLCVWSFIKVKLYISSHKIAWLIISIFKLYLWTILIELFTLQKVKSLKCLEPWIHFLEENISQDWRLFLSRTVCNLNSP